MDHQPHSWNRRDFLGSSAAGVGRLALASLLLKDGIAEANSASGLAPLPHFAPKAKRVIYLLQSGAPSQVDLFDYKPRLAEWRGQDLPDSVHGGQRLTTMTAGKSRKILPGITGFRRYGASGAWLCDFLPHTGAIADDLCFVRSMHTDAINHAPAVTLLLTGSQQPGRPSAGAWLSYGLGAESEDLPAFCVLTSRDKEGSCGQLFYDYYWGAGFLPSRHQGVRFRSQGDPVLYLNDPPGMSASLRRGMLDDIAELNRLRFDAVGDPEIRTRIAQYEMAFRMQSSVPSLADLSTEPASVLDMYGPDVERPGSYAANCLLARRLVERGVRFVQLLHSGWDQHSNLPYQLEQQCLDTDRPSAALVRDLKQRGLLDETLVIWGGEFGRTVFCQGDMNAPKHGRDHHPRCFTVWMAGGGVRGGQTYGATDDHSYNVVEDPVHVHDLQATILHLLGIDHERLTFRYQGRRFRLTDVHGRVIHELLA